MRDVKCRWTDDPRRVKGEGGGKTARLWRDLDGGRGEEVLTIDRWRNREYDEVRFANDLDRSSRKTASELLVLGHCVSIIC